MHSGADVEAFTAALNRDIEGDSSVSNNGIELCFCSACFLNFDFFHNFVVYCWLGCCWDYNYVFFLIDGEFMIFDVI